jgi:signal recognition particle subunit SEC65
MLRNVILWLAYFDCSLKRRLGRRVPLHLCISNPEPRDFLEVCKKLGLECEYIEKRYPRVWYKPLGMILVKNTELKKTKLINIIAKEVRELKQKIAFK